MITVPTPSSTADVAAFQQKFGDALIALMTLRQARSSDVSYTLSAYGIGVKQEDSGYTATVEPKDPYVGSDVKFADLSAEAQGKWLAQALQTAMRQAYACLASQYHNGITIEDIVPHLEALGLPLPSYETTVTGLIYKDGQQTLVSVRVNGTMSKEDAEAALASISEGHPHTGFLREAFGDALVESSLPKPVASVAVATQPVWPSTTEIVVEGA